MAVVGDERPAKLPKMGSFAGRFAFMSKYLDDLLFVIGAALVSTGAGMIYPPAAFIVAGVFCIAGAVLVARASQPNVPIPPQQVSRDPD